MSNNSLLLVDPSFNLDSNLERSLLLKITSDSFSYAILNSDSKQINLLFDKQACVNVAEDLQQAFKNDTYLTLKYKSVKVAVQTPNFVFIPSPWFNEENLDSYSQYFSDNFNIYHQENVSQALHTVFSINKNIEEQLPEKCEIFSQSAPLLAQSTQLADDALLLDFTAESFNVLLVKNKQIVYQNHYQIENEEEFNYYILLIIDQLKVSENIAVYIQGIINEDDDTYSCLLKYFNQIYFYLPTQYANSPILTDMPKHYFSGLLALNLCE